MLNRPLWLDPSPLLPYFTKLAERIPPRTPFLEDKPLTLHEAAQISNQKKHEAKLAEMRARGETPRQYMNRLTREYRARKRARENAQG